MPVSFWLLLNASFHLCLVIFMLYCKILSCTWTLLSSNIDWYEFDHCYNYYYDYTLYDLDRIDAIFLDRLLEYRLWLNFIASNFKKYFVAFDWNDIIVKISYNNIGIILWHYILWITHTSQYSENWIYKKSNAHY